MGEQGLELTRLAEVQLGMSVGACFVTKHFTRPNGFESFVQELEEYFFRGQGLNGKTQALTRENRNWTRQPEPPERDMWEGLPPESESEEDPPE